jgi:cell division protein FtsA
LRSKRSSESRRLDTTTVTAARDLWSRVSDRVRTATRGRAEPPAIAALDVGTEYAKALVVTVERDAEGRLVGVVSGTARQRQGLSHMQSGTVSDIDAVVANCRTAMDEARAMAGRRPMAAVIGIAGELVKGTTSVSTARRDDPRRPLDEAELERLVARAQEHGLRAAEERIRWESGVDRLDVRLVHAAIVEMRIDGYPVSNPIGFTGAQVELHLFNAFAPMVHLGALQSVANALEVELLGVIAEPYAVATCLDPGEMGDAGAVFIDIGGGTTDVALVRGGGISGTKMLALGGRAFTKGLVERLGVSFADAERAKLEEPESRPEVGETLLEDARVWRDGVELMIGELAGEDLLPGRVLLCGGGADLPQIQSVLDEDGWWERLPFARRPRVRALAPDEVVGLRDATGTLVTRQDVTPLALAHQALILDAGASAVDRAMRGVVREMGL